MKTVCIALLCTVALCAVMVQSECPNGCSGSGTCGPKDMCTCHNNYEGNDCSQRTCPFGYAFVDSPVGDIDFSQSLTTGTGKVVNSQQWPLGTWELYNDAAQAQEGHFYAECSKKGICERESGTCECFEGFEGSACQRTVCPNDCSGRGTCESIQEFATDAAGTTQGRPVATGTAAYLLWDAKMSYACRCDPGFYGPDCSLRRCKVGVDPMYEANGVEILETFLIRAGVDDSGSETLYAADSWIRLRVFDYWGESYVTDRIGVVDDTSTTTAGAAVKAAIEKLPNSVFATVTCEEAGVSPFDYITNLKTDRQGFVVVCQFTTNPGTVRLPEIHDSFLAQSAGLAATGSTAEVTGTTHRGEDVDWCATKSDSTVSTLSSSGGTSAVLSGADASITGNTLIKINNQLLLATTGTGTLTLAWGWMQTAITSATALHYSTATVTALNNVATWSYGATSFTMDDVTGVARGDILFFQNQIFYVQTIATLTVTVDRPFYGLAATGAPVTTNLPIYEITAPTTGTYTFVSECSGRGLCDSDTGICSCFTGYTNDNCDTQNILAI